MGVLGDDCTHRWHRAGPGMVRCHICEDLVCRVQEPARYASVFRPATTGHVDILYVVRAGEHNPWLRYSLRSLVNVPHRHVWIAGYRPSWVADTVGYIPTTQAASKYENSTGNLAAAVAHPDLAERFVFMNDDMFILRPLDEIPALHRGELGVAPTGPVTPGAHRLHRAMAATVNLLAGVGCDGQIFNYELHTPMAMQRTHLTEVLALTGQPGGDMVPRFTRTRYGNYWAMGGEEVADCKVRRAYGQPFDRDGLFLSTSPQSWRGPAGQHVRSLFPAPCGYERRHGERVMVRPYQPRAAAPREAVAR